MVTRGLGCGRVCQFLAHALPRFLILFAARNIKRDEELTLFYGSTYWQEGHIAGQAVDEGKSSVMDEPDDEWRPQDDEDEVMSIGY